MPWTLSFLLSFGSPPASLIILYSWGPVLLDIYDVTLPHDTFSKRINAFIMSMMYLLIMHMKKCTRPIRVDILLSLPILAHPLGHTIVRSYEQPR